MSDAGGRVSLSAHLSGPDGSFLDAVPLAYPFWSYTPALTRTGTYQVIIEAIDASGNQSWSSVFEIIVQ